MLLPKEHNKRTTAIGFPIFEIPLFPEIYKKEQKQQERFRIGLE